PAPPGQYLLPERDALAELGQRRERDYPAAAAASRPNTGNASGSSPAKAVPAAAIVSVPPISATRRRNAAIRAALPRRCGSSTSTTRAKARFFKPTTSIPS